MEELPSLYSSTHDNSACCTGGKYLAKSMHNLEVTELLLRPGMKVNFVNSLPSFNYLYVILTKPADPGYPQQQPPPQTVVIMPP